MTRPSSPIILPRPPRGMMSRTSVVDIVMTTPVANACTARPATSHAKLGPAAMTADPAPNKMNDPTNRLRVENLPRKNAFRGMTTASTSA